MFPLSDAPNPPRTPIVTYALIAVNVVVFLLFTFPMSAQAPSPADPRLAAYVEAGVTTLTVTPFDATLEQRLHTIRTMAEVLDESGLGA